jgi:glutamyl-tRNA reductase
MKIIVMGVRHKTAPIEIREKVSFDAGEIPAALRAMLTYPGIVESAILSTCNRTEVYASVTDTEQGLRSLKAFLRDYKQFDYAQNIQYSFVLLQEDAVMHLFRVASGLDSLVLGEGQIMAQVKETLKQSMLAQTSGEVIEKIFKSALSAGKAVRSQTGIANRDMSVSRAAFEFANLNTPQFFQHPIAVIGAGKMADILLSSLRDVVSDKRTVFLVNRTPDKVLNLSEKYGFQRRLWDELPDVILRSHTIFVATSSPSYVLNPEWFIPVSHKQLIIDISVPRNVDPQVGDKAEIRLVNTDDLSGYSGYTGENRVRLIHEAHQILEQEYQKYYQWLLSRSATPVITQLRNWVDDIRRAEVAGIEARCPHVNKSCSIIDELSRTLVNKIMHIPTQHMRSSPELLDIFSQAELLSRLFKVPEDVPLKDPVSAADLKQPVSPL